MPVPSAIRALVLAIATITPFAAMADDRITYHDDVFPILQLRCLECHTPGQEGADVAGLDLTTYEGLMKGTKHGPVIVPGNAFMSNLNVLIEGRAAPNLRMPHGKKPLTRCEIDIIRRWVNSGANEY